MTNVKNSSPNGVYIINDFLKNVPHEAGVYRMFDNNDQVLYVGKAKDLKKRIHNYTQLEKQVYRISRMILQTARMEITTTRTEAEALLLEANLIKSLKPRYNILLKDDKSFPYIVIEESHNFPRITKHRGVKKKNHTYFGPFASAGDVNRAITALQKGFLIRPCSDSVFKSATRPCMEHQIKRCSAPCAEKISQKEYTILIADAKKFLKGQSSDIQKQLTALMEGASKQMDYEKASIYRDRIKALTAIQASQSINAHNISDADIIGFASLEGKVCIQVFFIRGGQTISNKAFFPYQTDGYEPQEIIEAFIGNFYQSSPPPNQIIISHDLYAKNLLEEALAQLAGHKVNILIPLKGQKRAMIDIALTNAESALSRKLKEESNEKELLASVSKIFDIAEPINRIDVFDNSHIFGKHAVGAMVVAGPEGFIKKAYRKFNVDSGDKKTGGDDYLMMQQVLTRRYSKVADIKNKDESAQAPDLILIDGGPGHLSIAEKVFAELQLTIPYVCIAKGPDRNAGREDYYVTGKQPFKLPKNDPAGYYLQRLRDEAHRFAITTHRAKRDKKTIKSALDEIPGIGAARKRALLNHFGSVRAITEATQSELLKVESINKSIANTVFDFLH